MVHNVKNIQSPNGTNPYKRCHNSSKTACTGTLFIMYERRKKMYGTRQPLSNDYYLTHCLNLI